MALAGQSGRRKRPQTEAALEVGVLSGSRIGAQIGSMKPAGGLWGFPRKFRVHLANRFAAFYITLMMNEIDSAIPGRIAGQSARQPPQS